VLRHQVLRLELRLQLSFQQLEEAQEEILRLVVLAASVPMGMQI
jgi:hypothetical protein